VLVSSEDVGHMLLREAARCAPGRVVYLAHTPQFYPFGPEAWNPDGGASALVESAAAVVAISRSMAEYIGHHTGRAAHVVHPPMYGEGPYPVLGRFGAGRVAMINPCAIKGVTIFAGLAARFPWFPFAALTGWGTTRADRERLAALPNVELLPNVPRIRDLLAGTTVLLMPSLWMEGFGLIVTEAMLHGIPVIASDSGGLVEAKAGTRFLIPVPRVERYEPVYDERNLPRPVLPPPGIEPWAEALKTVSGDRQVYERESRAGRDAAFRLLAGMDPDGLEKLLLALRPAEAAPAPSAGLSPEKRALLLRRLQQQR
jgi:glycosyltransferase involved in cell wall biosynthesis